MREVHCTYQTMAEADSGSPSRAYKCVTTGAWRHKVCAIAGFSRFSDRQTWGAAPQGVEVGGVESEAVEVALEHVASASKVVVAITQS